MAILRKPTSAGLSDPSLVRQVEAGLAQASVIAKGKPTVTSVGELILPSTTVSTTSNSFTTTTSAANNQPADTVTVYNTGGAVYVSSIDQTVRQTIVKSGVSSIVAGNNITITSTGANGTGDVTIDSTGGGSGFSNKIVNGNSYANIATTDGNVEISVNGNSWNFDYKGSLSLPDGSDNPSLGAIQSANGYPTLLAYGSDMHGGPELDWMDANDPANSFYDSNVIRNTTYLNSTGLYIGMNENRVAGQFNGGWSFNPEGNVSFPYQMTNQRTGLGNAFIFGQDGGSQKIIATQNSVNGQSVERLVIAGGDGDSQGEGGDIYLWAGDSGGNGGTGGDIKVDAGQGFNGSQGGTIKIRGGQSVTNGSNVGTGGFIEIYAGSGEYGAQVDIQAGQGNGQANSGNITLTTYYGGTWNFDRTGNLTVPGNIIINNGIDGNIDSAGNVNINAGMATWNFANTGNLTAPGAISATGNITGGNLVTSGVLTSTVLTVDTLPVSTVAGRRAFVNDANIVAVGNFGQIVGNGGSNVTSVWSDGTDWRIG